MYKYRPTTNDGLKSSIRQTVNEVLQEMTSGMMDNFRNRLQQCIAARGRHLGDVMFNT